MFQQRTKPSFLGIVFSRGIGLTLIVVEFLGFVAIRGAGRLPKFGDRGYIIVSNHPSLFESKMMPFLRPFFVQWCFNERYIPISTPAAENVQALFRFFFRFFGHTMILIPRSGSSRAKLRVVRLLERAIEEAHSIVLFPEGTRTEKATCTRGIYEYKDRRMGRVNRAAHRTIERLRSKCGAHVIPIYVEYKQFRLWGVVVTYRMCVHIGKAIPSDVHVDSYERVILTS